MFNDSKWPNFLYIQFHRDCDRPNAVYVPLEHPRWGAIMGVMTTKEVSHREEIVVCDKVENKEVGGEEKDNAYTKKTEL